MGFLYNFNFFVVGFETQLMTETLAVTLLFGSGHPVPTAFFRESALGRF